jgi:beta-RFAP synthase
MILEGIVTTRSADGTINVAPMGPEVDPDHPHQIILKPFESSETYHNLVRHGEGVFHITDDVLLLARAVLSVAHPPMQPAQQVDGKRLVDCCRYFEFRVRQFSQQGPRARFICDVVEEGHVREFFGINRAKHAVVEAAILVSRIGILSLTEIRQQFQSLQLLIEKTGGPAEREAFDLLRQQVERQSNPRCRSLRITAPSRLHFGFFATPHEKSRAWGGIGLMVDQPSVVIETYARDNRSGDGMILANTVDPGIRPRLAHLIELIGQAFHIDRASIPLVHVLSLPPAHMGLGLGTQLTLAVAEGIRRIAGGEVDWSDESARRAFLHDAAIQLGRGRRSAIGIHGYINGGLVVDAGKLPQEQVGTKIMTLPPPPVALLVTPPLPPGPHGETEETSIARDVSIRPAISQELSDMLVREIAPSAVVGETQKFGLGLSRFNYLVGQSFAAVQGGPYASPLLESIVRYLADRQVGASQSSWGPTLYIPLDQRDEAETIRAELMTNFSLPADSFNVTSPNRQGAIVEAIPDNVAGGRE